MLLQSKFICDECVYLNSQMFAPSSVQPGVENQMQFLQSLTTEPQFLKILSLVAKFPVSLITYFGSLMLTQCMNR